jgi:hypothetical protein
MLYRCMACSVCGIIVLAPHWTGRPV